VSDDVVSGEDRVLGGRPHLRSRQVSTEAGVSLRSARKFWRALGFPEMDEEEDAFTESDVVALQRVSELVRDGLLDEVTALGLTRAVGRSVDRLASWQVQLLGEVQADEPGGGDVTELAALLADRFEPLVVYAWRRHLASALIRYRSEEHDDPGTTTMRRTIGFADLVSFTRVVRRLSERELARLVQRFEATASDVVASHGGRIIKTVGDEVLFVAWPPAAAAGIALDLAAEMDADPLLPEVRVGLSSGQVLARMGDVFGTTVNRASRLTSIASPGTVLADDATATSLGATSGFSCAPLRRRTLKGIGPVSPWLVTRTAVRGGPRAADPADLPSAQPLGAAQDEPEPADADG
jgi:adenylate cyclase